VVAVHRALPGVQRALDASRRNQLLASLAHVAAPGTQDGKRCPGPDQHANGDASGGLGKEFPQDRRHLTARQGEVRRDVPAGEVDVRSGARDVRRHRLEGLGPVDEHRHGVPLPWRRFSVGPFARRRIDGGGPAHAREASPVMGGREPLDQLAERAIGHIERAFRRHLR